MVVVVVLFQANELYNKFHAKTQYFLLKTLNLRIKYNVLNGYFRGRPAAFLAICPCLSLLLLFNKSG